MPPKKTPGISNNPVFQETNPSFEYASNARIPVGGISAINEVPCARCWLNAKSSPSSGTRITPPPIPNIPEATPHTHAIANIPVPRLAPLVTPAASGTGSLHLAVGRVRIVLRFSPEQECRQHQETSE